MEIDAPVAGMGMLRDRELQVNTMERYLHVQILTPLDE